MAKYGSPNLVVSIGGTDMSQHVDTINGFEVEAMIQESHTFGDSWVERLYSGVKNGLPFTMGGLYDDTGTTGPDAKFNTLGTTVAVILTWGGTKTSSFNALVTKYRRLPARGELTRYEVELTPTGAVTEA